METTLTKEHENMMIGQLTNTISQLSIMVDRLNKTIENQNDMINDLKKQLELMENKFQPCSITVPVLIDTITNEKGYTGKQKYKNIAGHILPYLRTLPDETIVDEKIVLECINTINNNTEISDHVKNIYLKSFMQIFKGYPVIIDVFNRNMNKSKRKTTPINAVLTEKELDKMWKVETITNTEEVVKILFLIECYTAMRYSDVFRISDSMINENLLTYISKKTGKCVRIPVPTEIIDMIKRIRGYDKYVIETSLKNAMNEILPELGKRAGINDIILTRRGGKVYRGPKYESMKTHTGRRTAITRWSMMGISLPEVQSMAGHSNITTTNRYINGQVTDKTINKLTKI